MTPEQAAIVVIGLVAMLFLLARNPVIGDAPGHCEDCTDMQGRTLSYDEIFALAQNAGFGSDSGVATAIALAESSGRVSAYNPETQDCTPVGEGSVGLWQIDRKYHAEFACMDLNDPQINANAAYRVYSDAGGFRPWSTFKNGRYQEFLQ